MSISIMLSAVMLAVAAQSSTAEPATPQVAAPVVSETVGATDSDEKMVCRRVRSIGSNMMTRDCRTVGQRRKDTEVAGDAMRNNRSIDNLDTGAR